MSNQKHFCYLILATYFFSPLAFSDESNLHFRKIEWCDKGVEHDAANSVIASKWALAVIRITQQSQGTKDAAASAEWADKKVRDYIEKADDEAAESEREFVEYARTHDTFGYSRDTNIVIARLFGLTDRRRYVQAVINGIKSPGKSESHYATMLHDFCASL